MVGVISPVHSSWPRAEHLSVMAWLQQLTSGLPVIREEPAALRRASPECDSTRCFADCRFEPAESAPGNSPSRKLTYYLRLFCIRPVRVLGKSASTPSR